MTISEARAVEVAREVASERGWAWEEPILVRRERAYLFFGRETYEVRTNTMSRGCNARIVIDAEDASVVGAYWLPR